MLRSRWFLALASLFGIAILFYLGVSMFMPSSRRLIFGVDKRTGQVRVVDRFVTFLPPHRYYRLSFERRSGWAQRDVIGLQVVTMGTRASEAAREWFAADRYQDYLYLHGISVEMAEAFAEYVHKRIRGELGFAAEEARDHDEMLNQGYRGSRYSFGYPACPNLADQRQLLELLGAAEIGLTLSEEDQLDPEQSTSAIVLHHPQAKYFSV